MTTSIAEAAARSESLEFIKAIHTGLGWASQLEYELLLARDLELLEQGHYLAMQASVVEVKKMLNGLSKSVRLQANQ